MDGWVKIGTALDNKQLEKDIKSAESKLKQFQREEEKLSTQKAKIDIDLASYEEQKQKIREATDLTLQQANTEEQVNWVLEQEKGEIAQLNNEYSKTLSSNESINQKIAQNKEQQSALNNEISEMNSKLSQSKGFQNVTNSIKTASSETSNIIKKIGKWALAVFSIRSAYSFIRSSISTVSQYNDQVATDIEYIRYALAMTLQPVIIGIINLVKTLLQYINYIAKAWFGVNLFANAGAKAFQKAKDNASGVKNNIDDAAKSAKKLNKELAGFDEMNVLGGNVDESGDTKADKGDVGGTPLPSFDLSAPEDIQPPTWLKWIVDNKDLILSVIGGITAGLIGWKLGLSGIQSLGFGIFIGSIIYGIQALLEYLKDPSWENFGKIIQSIGGAILGLGIMFMSVPAMVAGAGILIVGTVIKYWEQIKSFFQGIIDWLTEKSDWVHKMFGDEIGQIYDNIVSSLKLILVGFDNTFKGIKKIFDGVITFIKGVFSGNWKQAWNGVKQIFSGIMQALGGLVQATLGQIMGTVGSIALAIGQTVWSIIRGFINGVISMAENIINGPIRALNVLIGTINKIPGVNLGVLHMVSLPRLAKGGIINQPGRGVLLGGAVGGESGREGVIPLTDQQAMAQLGMEIGKNVVINLTNVTKLDNRQIAKEQKRINQQNDFAYNR